MDGIAFNIRIDSKILDKKGKATAFYDEGSQTIYLGSSTWIWTHFGANDLEKLEDNFSYFVKILNHEVVHHVLNVIFGKETSIMYDNIYYRLKHHGM